MILEELQQQEWYSLLLFVLACWVFAMFYVGISSIARHYKTLTNRLRDWEESMSRARKYKREMRAVSGAIASALEDAVYEGKLTQETKQFFYEQIGTKCNLPDLLPRKLFRTTGNIKEDIRNRLGPDVDKKLDKMRNSKTKDSNLVFLKTRRKVA